MVEWLAGNRIRGTSAEKPALALPSGSVGGWKELGRVNASVGEVTGLADKRYLMVLGHHIQGSGNSGLGLQINGDTTAGHYPRRYSGNGGNDATPTTETNVFIDTNGSTVSGKEWFSTMYIANKSDKEKLGIYNTVYNRNGLGSGQHPHRIEGVYKWTNTSNPISSIKFSDFNGTAMNSASEVIVLGWDPTDTHTTNFWEELASVNTGAGEVLDSGTFAAKKYLWFQFDIVVDTFNNTNATIRFNSDPNGNYARRLSQNGMATDSTAVGQTHMTFTWSGGKRVFGNYFVINNSSSEKLAIGHTNAIGTAANSTSEGAGVAPRRVEVVGKWADTSSQITQIEVLDTAQGDLGLTSGTIKVWGHD